MRQAAVRSRRLTLRFGNSHGLVANPKTSKRGHVNRHRWRLFVEVVSTDLPEGVSATELASALIQRVKFEMRRNVDNWLGYSF